MYLLILMVWVLIGGRNSESVQKNGPAFSFATEFTHRPDTAPTAGAVYPSGEILTPYLRSGQVKKNSELSVGSVAKPTEVDTLEIHRSCLACSRGGMVFTGRGFGNAHHWSTRAIEDQPNQSFHPDCDQGVHCYRK